MRKLMFIAALLVCTGGFAEAEEPVNHTGYWLNDLRNEADAMALRHPGASAFNVGIYYCYVVGAAEITEKLLWCSNGQVTNGQLIAVVSDYLKMHPDILTSAAKAIIGNALREAFPCPGSKK